MCSRTTWQIVSSAVSTVPAQYFGNLTTTEKLTCSERILQSVFWTADCCRSQWYSWPIPTQSLQLQVPGRSSNSSEEAARQPAGSCVVRIFISQACHPQTPFVFFHFCTRVLWIVHCFVCYIKEMELFQKAQTLNVHRAGASTCWHQGKYMGQSRPSNVGNKHSVPSHFWECVLRELRQVHPI